LDTNIIISGLYSKKRGFVSVAKRSISGDLPGGLGASVGDPYALVLWGGGRETPPYLWFALRTPSYNNRQLSKLKFELFTKGYGNALQS